VNFPLLFAILCILGVWALLFAATAGLGFALLRVAYGEVPLDRGLLPACWIGYAGAVAFVQIWHFFLPVDARATWTVLLLATMGWCSLGMSGLARLKALEWPRKGATISASAFLLWLADRCIGPSLSFDSAAYHLSVVSWNASYPIVPGLANLQTTLGFNNSGLLIAALLEIGAGEGRSHHFVNGFLVALLSLQLLSSANRLLERPLPGGASFASAVLLYPAVLLAISKDALLVSSHSTDIPAGIALFGATVLLLDAKDREQIPGGWSLDPLRFAGLLLLAIAPCLKITALIFSASAGILLLMFGAVRLPQAIASRPLRIALLFAILALGAWSVRGVVLSGYPFFPSTFAAMPVDWRVPSEYADGVRWWVQAFARTSYQPELLGQDFDWLAHWFQVELRYSVHEAWVPALLMLGTFLLFCASPRPRSRLRISFLALPTFIALAVWFVSAPSFRFGLALIWTAAAITAAALLPPVLPHFSSTQRRLVAVLLLLYSLSPLLLSSRWILRDRGDRTAWAALAEAFLVKPGPDYGFHPLYTPRMKTRRICGDVEILVPQKRMPALGHSGTWFNHLPWASPLPATAWPLEGLCARTPGRIERGFRIEDRGLPWAVRNRNALRDLQAREDWNVKLLAAHFGVTPSEVVRALRLSESPSSGRDRFE
jgi:hypothetical protein